MIFEQPDVLTRHVADRQVFVVHIYSFGRIKIDAANG
jgi:hypothetical protein